MKLFFLLLFSNISFSQNDSINYKKLYIITGIETITASSSFIYLNNLWYKNYPRESFHFFDDSKEWFQMDKCGHAFSAYYLSKLLSNGFIFTGINIKKSTLIGSSLGFVLISGIEVLDGFSTQWGASKTDLLANFTGSALYMSQNLLFNQDYIIPKYSYSNSNYSHYRPDMLGKNFGERLIKDYNSQTYWLSLNINAITKMEFFPKWFCLSFGYGANGMIGGLDNSHLQQEIYIERYRQYFFSIDIDLSKIHTKSKIFNNILKTANFIKIPLPTIEYSKNKFQFYPMYF